MALWNVYVGNFTKEFQHEIDYIETSRRALRSLEPSAKKDLRQVDEVPRFSEGIDRYSFDEASGALAYEGTLGGMANPQNFARHPTRPVLYSIEWTRVGRLAALEVQPDGTLRQLSRVITGGELADAVCIDPAGRFAYVAHWGDGSIVACALAEDGSITGAEVVVEGNPRGFFTREYFHDIRIAPSGDALVLTDVGNDEIVCHNVGKSGEVDPRPSRQIGFPAASHPRNLHYSPSGAFAYVGGQWDSMLHVLSVQNGLPCRRLASYSTVPPDFGGENAKIAQFEVHPQGHAIYVANRNSNSIAVFKVAPSGFLAPPTHVMTEGRGPSTVAVSPSGRHLFVGNVFSASIEVFAIDEVGQLSRLGPPVDAFAPRVFEFFPTGG